MRISFEIWHIPKQEIGQGAGSYKLVEVQIRRKAWKPYAFIFISECCHIQKSGVEISDCYTRRRSPNSHHFKSALTPKRRGSAREKNNEIPCSKPTDLANTWSNEYLKQNKAILKMHIFGKFSFCIDFISCSALNVI